MRFNLAVLPLAGLLVCGCAHSKEQPPPQLNATLFQQGDSYVKIKTIPKQELFLASKGFRGAGVKFNAATNRWVDVLQNAQSHEIEEPVCYQALLIGKGKIPVYRVPGNLMADDCERKYIILTDQDYVIQVSGSCYQPDWKRIHDALEALALPAGTKAVKADCKESWYKYDFPE